MGMESGFTPSDAIALQSTAARDGYGYGFGGDSWVWIILILLFAGGGMWGNRNIANDTLLGEEFIKRDIFNTNQNVSSTGCQTQRDVLENRYTTQLGLQQLGQQSQSCCCETQKEILENRYANALAFKDQLYAQQQCCCETNRNIDAVRAENFKNTCEITNAIHAEGEATRALIQANTMQELRDKLADRDRDLMSANLALQNNAQTRTLIDTLQPVAKPSYLTCSPYFAYQNFGCGCNPCGNGFSTL